MSPRLRMFRDAADLRRLADWLEDNAPADNEVPIGVEPSTAQRLEITYYRYADWLEREAATAREFARIHAPRIP